MILAASLLIAFLLFLALYLVVGRAASQHRAVSSRVQEYAGIDLDAGRIKEPSALQEIGMALRRWLQKRARKNARKKQGTSLDMRMQQAGIPLQGSEFLLLLLVLFAIVLIVGWILTGSAWNGGVIGVGVCMAAWFYVLHRVKSRHDAFVHQLGDCLSLVANALRAGFSFLQTMELISREMQPPMNTEFGRVVRETSLGVPMEQALRRMDARVNSPDFSLIVTAVIIQQQVGGNLAEILDTINETIRERVRLRREIGTLTAQGRATGAVLALLPPILGVVLYMISPEYMQPLLTTTYGHIAIGVGFVMEVIGFLVIRKIMDIKI
uniref:type II secretion system F family protein n=1 Tax=uncultured Allisonella sp. TaxID=339338 RepID=UPI00267029F1|nr:type II secretion system F family protein [uncultured Allisonella sp.]